MGLGALLLERQHALRAAQIEVDVLAEAYRASPTARRRHAQVVDLLELPRGGPDIVGALLVHPSGLLDALVALFESEWERATPVRVEHDRVRHPPEVTVTELDTRFLSLLLAGLTDQATAVQLGLSIRTVQRRVRHLMDLAGVQTRLQLGWHAARNGWV